MEVVCVNSGCGQIGVGGQMEQWGPTWVQHGSNMGPTWVQHGSNMGPTWVQHGSNMGPTWVQHGSNMGFDVHEDLIEKICI